VLFLDPSHERALANLDRLHGQKDDGSRTITMDVVVPVSVAAAAASPHARAARPEAPRARRPVAWIAGVLAALTLITGASFWFTRAHRTSGEDRQTLALKTNVAADTLAAPRAAKGTEKKPPATSEATKPTMTASSSDAGATPIIDTRPELPASGPHVPAVKPVRSVPMEQGSLSVYFLGGVGDVWIDGKLFPHQPPFEKAPLSAGKHRVSCRMSEDKESHEITVKIRPEKETVIEYEVGATPVVSED
jgi:hypothetical protein